MEPIRIRVSRIIDFGTVVSIVGIDLESNRSVAVHVDHRPFAAIWDDWKALGFPQPITFDAERLTIKIDPEAGEELDLPLSDNSPDSTSDLGTDIERELPNVSA